MKPEIERLKMPKKKKKTRKNRKPRPKIKDLPMQEYGIEPSNSTGTEYIIKNSGHRIIDEVEVGGRKIALGSSGATLYNEPELANEIEDMYKLDPNITVIRKDHRRLQESGHGFVFSTKGLNVPRSGVSMEDDPNWTEVKPGKWKYSKRN